MTEETTTIMDNDNDNDTMNDDSAAAALPDIADDDTAFEHIPQHGFSLFLSKRCKTIHFVRHAEGLHNQANRMAGDDTPVTFSTNGSWNYQDSKLTARGIQQCVDAKRTLLQDVTPQLIVVSPFSRTLQTAHIMFGGNNIKFMVHDLARERSGKYTCDKRRNRQEIVAELQPLYHSTGDDSIDFDSYGYPQEEDVYWQETREESASVTNRGIALMQWLATRPETEIAVVTHSSFLKHLFRAFGENIHNKDQETLHRVAGNAEVRSVCLALHKGFYPPGKWEGDEFVPTDPSFRRGKWAPSHASVAASHKKLLMEQEQEDSVVSEVNDGHND